MQYNLDEIRKLSEILEYEAMGQPFDRSHARELAEKLGEQHPAISRSMKVLLQRLEGSAPLAQCA